MNVDYRKRDGWGIVTRTIKNYRFFPFEYVVKNNLWVENYLIVSIKYEYISLQSQITDRIYIREIPIPLDYRQMLFL